MNETISDKQAKKIFKTAKIHYLLSCFNIGYYLFLSVILILSLVIANLVSNTRLGFEIFPNPIVSIAVLVVVYNILLLAVVNSIFERHQCLTYNRITKKINATIKYIPYKQVSSVCNNDIREIANQHLDTEITTVTHEAVLHGILLAVKAEKSDISDFRTWIRSEHSRDKQNIWSFDNECCTLTIRYEKDSPSYAQITTFVKKRYRNITDAEKNRLTKIRPHFLVKMRFKKQL